MKILRIKLFLQLSSTVSSLSGCHSSKSQQRPDSPADVALISLQVFLFFLHCLCITIHFNQISHKRQIDDILLYKDNKMALWGIPKLTIRMWEFYWCVQWWRAVRDDGWCCSIHLPEEQRNTPALPPEGAWTLPELTPDCGRRSQLSITL